MLQRPKPSAIMTDDGVLVAAGTTEPKPSLFARFKKQSKEKKARKEKKPITNKNPKKSKKEKPAKKNKSVEDDSVKAAAPSPLMSIFHTAEKKKPRSEYQSEIDQLTDELKQTKQQLAAAQERNAIIQEKFDHLKRWATSPPV